MQNNPPQNIRVVKADRLIKDQPSPEKSEEQKALDRRRRLLRELKRIEEKLKD